MKTTLLRAGALSCALLATTALTTPARAETPIDQCTDTGITPETVYGSGGGFAPGNNLATISEPEAASPLGTVNPATGAFVYSSRDLSVGAGEFPARLGLVRTYSSDQDGPNGWEVEPFAPWAAGSRQWFAFGRGATHDMDITFERVHQTIGGQTYLVILIRSGFQTEAFQQCTNGVFMNTRRNGSRLFPDASYSTGGYRYESRDGAVLLFEKISAPNGGHACTRQGVCGVLRRWTAPNGDWAQFDYQDYYSHPSNRSENSNNDMVTNPNYSATLQECRDDFDGVNECHGTRYGTLYTSSGTQPAITSSPIYNRRLTSVSNSRGYRLNFAYVDQSTNPGGYCPSVSFEGQLMCVYPATNTTMARNRVQSVAAVWTSPSGQITPLAQVSYGYESCNSSGSDCLASVTMADGSVTRYGHTDSQGARGLTITLPGNTSPLTTVTYATAVSSYYYPDRRRGYYSSLPRYDHLYFRVARQQFADGSTTQYNPTFSHRWVEEPHGTWAWLPFISSMQIVEPGNATTTIGFVDETDYHSAPVSIVDPLGRPTINTYNAVGAPLSTTFPEGNRVVYGYDARGNVVSLTRYPEPGSNDSPLGESYTYWAAPTVDAQSCTNQRLCNRPTRHTDARGFHTDFTWDAATGLPLSETRPAGTDGLRPTITYGYAALAGANSSSVRLPTSKTERIDATSNVVTSFGYTADGRLAQKEVSRTAGGVTLRSCFGTDQSGNVVSETQPNAALASCP